MHVKHSLTAFFVIALLMFTFMGYGIYMESAHQRDQMQACVAAGMEWKRDFGSHYECVKE